MLKNILKTTVFASMVVVLGACTLVESNAATVKEDLNLRKGASTEYNITHVLNKGEEINIISESNGWYKVKTSDEQVGWSYGKYIEASNEEKEEANAKKGQVTVNLNFRKGPSMEDEIIYVHEVGTELKVLSQEGDWYKVKTSDNKIGWSYGKYINEIDDKTQLVHSANVSTDVNLTSQHNSSTTNNTNTSNSVNSTNISSSKKTMVVSATAYSGDGITATGTKPRWGTIAVDPRVIPYGTKVYIPQFNQVFIAEDCGGGIKGNKIDIFMNSNSQCINWGVRNISIQILD